MRPSLGAVLLAAAAAMSQPPPQVMGPTGTMYDGNNANLVIPGGKPGQAPASAPGGTGHPGAVAATGPGASGTGGGQKATGGEH